MAGTIAGNAPLAVRESRGLMLRAASADERDDAIWDVNASVLARVFSSEDAREGPRAFAEKRSPEWTGR